MPVHRVLGTDHSSQDHCSEEIPQSRILAGRSDRHNWRVRHSISIPLLTTVVG